MDIPSNEATAKQLEQKLISGLCRGGIVPGTELLFWKSFPKGMKPDTVKDPDSLVSNLQIKMSLSKGTNVHQANKAFCTELDKLARSLLQDLSSFVTRPEVRKVLDMRGVRQVQLVVHRTLKHSKTSQQTATVNL